MRALVTGGAGFIGSHLVDALVERGDSVLVLDDLSTGKTENLNGSASFVEGDVRDAAAVDAAFEELDPEVCFHLAAQADVRRSIEDPVRDSEINTIGTIRALEASRRHGTQLILSSTGGAIYGECAEPALETAARLPLSPYGTSKLAAEEYLGAYGRLYGTTHVALRYANVYGPRQDPHGEAGVVAIFLGRIAAGEPPRIFGDGRQTRDYVYVGDVVAATLAAAGQDGGVFNVGTGVETSVLDLAQACARVTGAKFEPLFEPARLGELERSVLDPELAADVLGFRAEVSVEDGLERIWAEGEDGRGPK